MTIRHLYPAVEPSLNLDFANSKRLDSRITFSRGSTGTYIDESGIIRTAAANEARFDHDSDGNSLGLLIEESRTNLLTYSQEFDDATWSKVNANITPNAIAAPDGTTTADNLIANATNSSHFIFEPLAVSSGATTCSIYAKSAGLSWVTINVYDGGAYRKFSFNVSTGEKGIVASGLSSSIEPCANGWYRISCTYVSTGAQNTIHFMLYDGESTENFLGDGTSGIYIWGAQVEAGSFPTSYIPTAGATATRAADLASITGTNFSSWYNQSEGSFLLHENNSFGVGLAKRFELVQNSSPNSNAIAFSVNYGNGTRISSRDSNTAGTIDCTLFNVWSLGGSHKYGYGLRLNDFVVASGTSIATDTAGTFPPNLDSLSFGAINRATSLTNKAGSFRLSRLTYYPVRLPDATLQALTL